jgi:hypothetical protein
MTLNASGSLGIGTTSPVGKFSILNDGAAAWTQYIQTPITTNKRNSIGFFDYTGANIAAILTDVNADNTADFGISVPNGSPRLVIKSSGNVLIGTTTDDGSKLQINGTYGNLTANFIGVTTASGSFGIGIAAGTNTSDYAMYISNAAANTQYFKVTGDGNTIIGNGSNNGYKLEVNGTGKFTGALSIGNSVSTGVAVTSTHKVSILIGGVQYYLLASNV